MKINYVLVDHENVGLDSVDLLKNQSFRLLVFVGALQNRISVETASAIQRLGDRAEYIKISGSGKNALDFHMAFYLGRLANLDPMGYFHLISKDKGFDPLVIHLQEQSVHAARRESIAEIPLLQLDNATTPATRAKRYADTLSKPGATRPKKLLTLSSAINALFQKKLSDSEIQAVASQLQKDGILTIDAQTGAVAYSR